MHSRSHLTNRPSFLTIMIRCSIIWGTIIVRFHHILIIPQALTYWFLPLVWLHHSLSLSLSLSLSQFTTWGTRQIIFWRAAIIWWALSFTTTATIINSINYYPFQCCQSIRLLLSFGQLGSSTVWVILWMVWITLYLVDHNFTAQYIDPHAKVHT